MNKFLNVVLKESCFDSPFAPKNKCIVTAAAIAAGASIAAAAGQSISSGIAARNANEANLLMNQETNRTNRQIARETNEMNMSQFNTNMQWLKEQYYKNRQWQLEERAYNSPQQQVERLIAAGINPAMISGAGNDSSVLSSVGAPSQSSFQAGYAQAGHVEPVNYLDGLSESIGHAFNSYHQNRLVDANTKKTNADAQISRADAATRFMRNVSELRKMWVETEKMKSDKNLSESQRKFLEKQSEDLQNKINLFMDTYDEQIRQMELGNNLLDARARHENRQLQHIDFEENLALKRYEIENKLANSSLHLNSAQISLIFQQAALVGQQKLTEVSRGREIEASAVNKEIENIIIGILKETKQFEYGKWKDSQVLREVQSFSHYLGDILFSQIKLFGR